jgi:hypothetical protein
MVHTWTTQEQENIKQFVSVIKILLFLSDLWQVGGFHFQQYVSYSVDHSDQFYWCLTTLSTMSGITYNMVASFIGV